jgi:isocitrate lyase
MPLELINNYNGKVIIATLVEVEDRVEKLKKMGVEGGKIIIL